MVFTSVTLIACVWVSFYVALFTATTSNLQHQDFFLNNISQKLSSAQRDLCKGLLTFGCHGIGKVAWLSTSQRSGLLTLLYKGGITCR